MSEIEERIKDLTERPNLNIELERFVDFIYLNKFLTFPSSAYPDLNFLCENNIIKTERENCEIIDYLLISIKFIELYKSSKCFDYTVDFKETAEFLKEIQVDFTNNEYLINYYKLEKELWKIAIFETNKKHQGDFVNYVASLDKDSNRYGMIRFIEPYTKILPFLNINIEGVHFKTKPEDLFIEKL